MTDAAIIAGSLVDAKNVNTHKVMRLIIDVPAENALKVIAAFGWPTMVNPVHVAVARLTAPDADSRPNQELGVGDARNPGGYHALGNSDTHSIERRVPRSASTPPTGDDKPAKSPAQIAGYLCTLPSFQKFLKERFGDVWAGITGGEHNEPLFPRSRTAAAVVRTLCNVDSRADINPNNTEWLSLQLAWKLWNKEVEVVPS